MKLFAQTMIALGLSLYASFAQAQNVHGILRVVKGDVQIKSAKTNQLVKARLGEKVFPKDVILTGKDSRAKIVMVDNNELNVSPESQIEIQNYEFDPEKGKKDVLLNVIYGKVRSKVEQKYDGKTTKFQIKTAGAVAGVRGTDFMMSFNQENRQSQVVTFQGRVEFGTPGPGGSISNPVFVDPGKAASVGAGQTAPSPPREMPKEELAKVEQESKAEPVRQNESGGQSQGQSGGDKKQDSDKKDESGEKGKGPDPKGDSKGPDSKGDSANKGGDKAETGGQAPSNNASNDSGGGGPKPSASGESNGSTSSQPAAPAGQASSEGSSSSSGSRQPASVGAAPTGGNTPPPPGPSAGSGMFVSGDFAGGDTRPPPIMPVAPAPPVVPQVPLVTPISQQCDFCNRVIQDGSTKLTIIITPPTSPVTPN